MPERRTALISGAGVAGPSLAYWLNVAGWKTTIVERAPTPRSGGYVIDFWGLGYDLAERMGLKEAIDDAGYHVRELRVVGDRGERVAGFGTRVFEELTTGRYVTLPRSGLSRLILNRVAPDSEIIFGDEIVALSDRADCVLVGLRSGIEREVDLIVGADGLRSAVRRLAFGADERFERPLGYAVAAFEASGYRPRDPDVYMLYGKPGRMVGRFTLHEERSFFLFVFGFDGALPTAPVEQRALIDRLYRGDAWEVPRILERLRTADDLYLDRVSQIQAPAWSSGRVVLVGDAAFCVSLLAGQGSALAMVAAYVLAGEVSRSDQDMNQALARYERRLRAFIETKQAGAKRFAGALAPRTEFGLWFRNLVVSALAIPGLAKAAVGREIIDRLELPDYRFGKDAASTNATRLRTA